MMYFVQQLVYAITYPIRALLYQPSKLFAPLRWLVGLSVPTKVSILTFFFWVICVVTVFVLHSQDANRAEWSFFMTWWWAIAILVLVIPIVVYFTLKLWLEAEVSPFPDIDHAWKAGLAEFQRQGLDLSQTPLFLVVGSAGENQERALFQASRMSFNVEEFPRGPNALHWYANADGVYLVGTQVGRLSRVAAAAKRVSEDESIVSAPVRPKPRAETVRGTVVTEGGPAAMEEEQTPAGSPRPPDMASSNIRGTMMIPGGAMPLSEAAPTAEKRPVRLEQQEAIEQDRRLAYLCRLIRRKRQPLCSVNGVLTLLPFGLLQRSRPDAYEVQGALQKDILALSQGLKLRCPATALVAGMEDEPGFQELVRRVGRERCAGQRFGRGFSLSNPPAPDRLKALCAHACGSFEDWVYALFCEKGSLSRPGNTKLYSLLVKIRGTVQNRLADVLAEGFAAAGGQDRGAESLFFGGCYFAAVGETEDRQAFVKGVLEKLPEQQEEVQWTEAAIDEDRRLQNTAQWVLMLCTALLVGLGAMIVQRFYR